MFKGHEQLPSRVPPGLFKTSVIDNELKDKSLVLRKVDNAIHWINLYPMGKAIHFPYIYPLDKDLSNGWRYPTFEQPGERKQICSA